MSSLVSYGKLRPSFIGVLSIIVRSLLTRTSASIDRVKLCTVDELIDFSDSGIWGDVSIDPASELRVFRVSDFKGDFELDYSSPTYRAITEQQKQKYKLAGGDILVVKSSGSAKQVVSGRVAVFESNGEDEYAASNFLMRLRPKKDMVDPYYLGFVLGSPLIREEIANSVKTMTYPNLSYKLYRRITVPIVAIEDQKQIAAFLTACLRREELLALPPYLSEPRQIVARIEELAAKLEEARGLRQRTTAELELLVTRTAGEVFGGEKYLCEQLGNLLREGSRNDLSPRPNDTPPGLPILRISAGTSRADGVVDEQDYKYLEITDEQRRLYRLEPGDLLACRFNGNLHYVGRFSLFAGKSGEPRLYPDKLIRFRVDTSRVMPEFVRSVMNSPYGRARIEEFCQTTAGNIGISAKNLYTIPVPVPPLEEQHRIVAHMDSLQAKVDRLKDLQAQTATELEAMLPSILDKAFKGEL